MVLELITLLLFNFCDLPQEKVLESYKSFTSEVTCLAQNIYFEARSESINGQIAVGQVTLNRLHSSKYPNTICEVTKQNQQFSWYWDGKSDKMTESKAKQQSYEVALGVITGKYPNIIRNSTHYHNFSVSPYWVASLELVIVIDDHTFYK